jgi:hypothetical protein
MAMPLQRLNQGWQKGNKSLRTNVIGRRPRQVQCLLHFWAVVGCPWTLDHQLGHHRMTQESDGILASVACGRDKLIENDRFQCR